MNKVVYEAQGEGCLTTKQFVTVTFAAAKHAANSLFVNGRDGDGDRVVGIPLVAEV